MPRYSIIVFVKRSAEAGIATSGSQKQKLNNLIRYKSEPVKNKTHRESDGTVQMKHSDSIRPLNVRRIEHAAFSDE